jgi:hypothetical protein
MPTIVVDDVQVPAEERTFLSKLQVLGPDYALLPIPALSKKGQLADTVDVPIGVDDGPQRWAAVSKFMASCARRVRRGRHERRDGR